ncbi:MAG TPA: hypothetical protein PK807_05975 [Verrucomicrobiota bacterium]|jgi:hypothetical protein|nr:hypothetical protein [Verrucomicrobiota bacterium]
MSNKNEANTTKKQTPRSPSEELFYALLHCETEEELTNTLQKRGMLQNEADWLPLGEMENNWSAAGNQQSAAGAALVEKMVNGIDSVLIYECLKRGIDPTSSAAPQSMADAAKQFFKIPNGRLENIPAPDRTALAKRVQLIAVGSKEVPNYLIVDDGEGQAPVDFPDTFLSIARSNKLHIHFVQGKYNAGGTGALRFCGQQNYQLIVSRRAPGLSAKKQDPTNTHWGFTLVRRLRPTDTSSRKSSMYVYYAPAGRVPSFPADAVTVLAGEGAVNKPPTPYTQPLKSGSCIKLYAYQWNASGIATRDPRYQLNKYLHNLVLPIRVTETRQGYRANYYSTTVSGGSIDENIDLDLGPASGSIALPRGIGTIPVELKVFKDKKPDGSDIDTRHLPKGVLFTVNGQVHGSLPATFVARKLNYTFLEDYLLLVVDATEMPTDFREDFFMTSRDRLVEAEDRDFVENEIKEFLKNHEGLRLLNNARKEAAITKTVEADQPLDLLQELINDDPTLASLFGVGDRLKTPYGKAKEAPPYVGKRFPTYFRLKKENLVKDCPINRTCRVEFETDAVDDYFSRGDEPGQFSVVPPSFNQGYRLYHGSCSAKFCPPVNCEVGDLIDVQVQVTDPSRETNPFTCKFKLRITPKELTPENPPERERKPKEPEGGGISLPKLYEIMKPEWPANKFDEHSGLRFTGGQNGDPLEAFVNMENIFLTNELARAKDESERKLLRHYYKNGLALVTLGMLQEAKRRKPQAENGDGPAKPEAEQLGEDLDTIFRLSGGVAAVIIPVVRSLAATAAKIVS